MIFKKKTFTETFFRVRCDGWLYASSMDTLTSNLDEACKFKALEDAVVSAKLFGRDEKFEVIENRDGKVIFHNILEEAYNA